jgi:pimeloyl-ACP methyl ester carboxylesterase
LVDIGGRSLYLECWGDGAPTILFLHGGGGNHSHGNHLTTGYPANNRVCLYDRANMGESDPSDGTQTGADVVDDLNRLLEAADVPGPYLLVANSFGGVVAELFAASNPDSIAGMVLVDASLHADADVDRYFDELGEIDLGALEAEFAAGPEKILYSIHDEARDALASIPDVPIRYLRASESALPAEPQEIWNAGLDALLARSSDGIVIDVDGPHTLPPPPVHDAIDDILSAGQ